MLQVERNLFAGARLACSEINMAAKHAQTWVAATNFRLMVQAGQRQKL